MRWAQAEARLPDSNELVGRAHGDDRGEFLLLLDSRAASLPELTDPLNLRVNIWGPGEAPLPDDPQIPEQDQFWDLPLEQLPESGQEEELTGPLPNIFSLIPLSLPLLPGERNFSGFLQQATGSKPLEFPKYTPPTSSGPTWLSRPEGGT